VRAELVCPTSRKKQICGGGEKEGGEPGTGK